MRNESGGEVFDDERGPFFSKKGSSAKVSFFSLSLSLSRLPPVVPAPAVVPAVVPVVVAAAPPEHLAVGCWGDWGWWRVEEEEGKSESWRKKSRREKTKPLDAASTQLIENESHSTHRRAWAWQRPKKRPAATKSPPRRPARRKTGSRRRARARGRGARSASSFFSVSFSRETCKRERENFSNERPRRRKSFPLREVKEEDGELE